MAKRKDIQGDFSVRKAGQEVAATSVWEEASKLARERDADGLIYTAPSGLQVDLLFFSSETRALPKPKPIRLNIVDSNPLVDASLEDAGTGYPYWIVTGPRVMRGGRVEPKQRSRYGTVSLDGFKITNWQGRGEAGRHAETYLEILQYMLTNPKWVKENPMSAKESAGKDCGCPPVTGPSIPTPTSHVHAIPETQRVVGVVVAGECLGEDCIGHHTHGPPTKPEVVTVVPVAEEEPAPKSECAPQVGATPDARRYNACRFAAKRLGALDSPEKIYELLAAYMNKEEQEVVIVVPLDIHAHLKGSPVECHRGGRSQVMVEKRVILQAALKAGGNGFVLVHQHPGKRAEPSKADRELTKQVRVAGAEVGMPMVDHVVIAPESFYSFEEEAEYRLVKGKWKRAS
jgi:proteasome lid subunit RPN8/RPN11